MTRERAKELIPIMQAWVDGKQIQAEIYPTGWKDVEEFHAGVCRYQIKPEPREWWLVPNHEMGVLCGFVSMDDALACWRGSHAPTQIIRVREVLE